MEILKRAAAMLGLKRMTTTDKYEAATVRISDAVSKQYTYTNIGSMVSRGSVGYAEICSRVNASTLAGLQFRLYRKKRAKGGNARTVSRSRKAWMSEARNAGAKVASFTENADDIEEVTEHPILDVLRKPNPDEGGFEYWESHHGFLEVCGNAFHGVVNAGGRPWLYRMMPQFVKIQPDAKQHISGYWYGRESSKVTWFEKDEVVHAVFVRSKSDPYYGVGPLTAIVPEHDLRVTMNQHASNLFARGARPDVWVSWKDKVGEDFIKKARQEIEKHHSGVENTGKWFLAGGDVALHELSFALKDLEYINGRAKLESDIMAAFGVPEAFLRMNDANLASATTAHHGYMSLTILPRAVKFQDWFNTQIIAGLMGYDEGDFWICVDNPVPKDEVASNLDTRQDVLAGVITVNEARLARGLEAIDDPNADRLLINGRPLAEPAPDPFGGFGSFGDDDEDEDPEDKVESEDGEKSLAADSGLRLPVAEVLDQRADDRDGVPAGGTPCDPDDGGACGVPSAELSEAVQSGHSERACGPECVSCNNDEEHNALSHRNLWWGGEVCCPQHAEFSDGLTVKDGPHEPIPHDPLTLTIAQYFADQRDAILRTMQEKPNGKQFGGIAIKDDRSEAEALRLLRAWGITDFERWNGVLLDRIKPEVDRRFLAAAAQGLRAIQAMTGGPGESVSFDMTNDRAAEFVQRQGRVLYESIQSVNETTAQRLAVTLAEGIREGEALNTLSLRVRAAFDGEATPGESVSAYRARMIARTETARAQENGSLAGWEASGVVEGKEWVLAPNACEFCEAAAQEFNDKPIPLDQPFYAKGSVLRGTDGGTLNIDFDDVMGGALHPNCRCYTRPVLKGGGR